jgi:hypothetical protein
MINNKCQHNLIGRLLLKLRAVTKVIIAENLLHHGFQSRKHQLMVTYPTSRRWLSLLQKDKKYNTKLSKDHLFPLPRNL